MTYVGAVLSGDLIFWQYCYERYTQLRRDKDNLDERIELLKALGVTKDAWLQNRLLTYVMTLPSAEITPTLEAIASTPTGERLKLLAITTDYLIFRGRQQVVPWPAASSRRNGSTCRSDLDAEASTSPK